MRIDWETPERYPLDKWWGVACLVCGCKREQHAFRGDNAGGIILKESGHEFDPAAKAKTQAEEEEAPRSIQKLRAYRERLSRTSCTVCGEVIYSTVRKVCPQCVAKRATGSAPW